jgi:hypothetical protein
MKPPMLFVSFHDICLMNLPGGTFRKRLVRGAVAKKWIDEARLAGRLLCVTDDDLGAARHKSGREDTRRLCACLGEEFGIELTLNDFFSPPEEESDGAQFANPLQCARVSGESRLIVVTCNFSMPKKPAKGARLEFVIAPGSVEFHVFEVVRRRAVGKTSSQ